MARGGQRGYGNAGRSAYSGASRGAQARAVFMAGGGAVSRLVDDLGFSSVDELGNRLIASPVPPAMIKDAAAARGLRFGIAVEYNHSTAIKNATIAEADVLIPETASLSSIWYDGPGQYDWSRFDQHMAMVKNSSKDWWAPSGFIYPKHDNAWVATGLTSANVYQTIDELVAAFRDRVSFHGVLPLHINASNELVDPDQADRWHRNPWYNATGGPSWLIYLIKALKAAFPNVPIGLCQDLTEQFGSGDYGSRIRSGFLTIIDVLIASDAAPDYVDLQGHLKLDDGWNPVTFRTFLQAIRTRGIKIVAGEVDIRAGETNLPNYSVTAMYDAKAAYMVSQYLDVLIPYLDMGQLGAWTLADPGSWALGERPCLYDASLIKKPAMYGAFLETLNWS